MKCHDHEINASVIIDQIEDNHNISETLQHKNNNVPAKSNLNIINKADIEHRKISSWNDSFTKDSKFLIFESEIANNKNYFTFNQKVYFLLLKEKYRTINPSCIIKLIRRNKISKIKSSSKLDRNSDILLLQIQQDMPSTFSLFSISKRANDVEMWLKELIQFSILENKFQVPFCERFSVYYMQLTTDLNSSYLKNKNSNKYLMEVMDFGINFGCCQKIMSWFRNIVMTILLLKCIAKEIKSNDSAEEIPKVETNLANYKASPFFIYFPNKKSIFEKDIKKIFQKLISQIPLWTNAMGHLVENDSSYISSATFEGYWNYLKASILNKTNTASKFVRSSQKAVQEKILQIKPNLKENDTESKDVIENQKEFSRAEKHRERMFNKTKKYCTLLDNFKKSTRLARTSKTSDISEENQQLKQLEFHTNSTISNLSYYNKIVDDQSFFIANFRSSLEAIYPVINFATDMKLDEYQDMNYNNRWLRDVHIDFYLSIFLKAQKQYSYIISNQVLQVMHKEYSQEEASTSYFLENLPVFRDIVFMPVNLSQAHWVLIVVNFLTKEFSLLDPSGQDKRQERKYFECIKDFLLFLIKNKHYPEKIGDINFWKIRTFNYQLQNDNFNCGVRLLQYVEVLTSILSGEMNESELKYLQKPAEFRVQIQEDLIRNSDSVKSLCLNCGYDIISLNENLQCSLCKRPICDFCLSTHYTNLEEHQICKLCLAQ